MRKIGLWLFAIVMAAGLGCTSSSIEPGQAMVDLTGSWRGEWQSERNMSGSIDLVFVQTGGSLEGTAIFGNGDWHGHAKAATVTSGTVTTDEVIFDLTATDDGCEGNYIGTISADNSTITGSYVTCNDGGTYTITRQ